jgi:hypothetical protein
MAVSGVAHPQGGWPAAVFYPPDTPRRTTMSVTRHMTCARASNVANQCAVDSPMHRTYALLSAFKKVPQSFQFCLVLVYNCWLFLLTLYRRSSYSKQSSNKWTTKMDSRWTFTLKSQYQSRLLNRSDTLSEPFGNEFVMKSNLGHPPNLFTNKATIVKWIKPSLELIQPDVPK